MIGVIFFKFFFLTFSYWYVIYLGVILNLVNVAWHGFFIFLVEVSPFFLCCAALFLNIYWIGFV